MVLILLVEKNGTIKEINAKQFDDVYLSKKAGFKSPKGFLQNNGWSVNNMNIFLYGKTEGRAGQENKYDFPPPIDNTLFFGGCLLIAKNGKNEIVDLNLKIWKDIYEKLFGGFEDLGDEDSEEEEEEEDEDIPQTKQGYAKDGFVVDDEEEDEDEEDDEEEDDEDDDEQEDDEEEDEQDDDDEDDEDEDDDEQDDEEDEIIERAPPKKRVQPKRKVKNAHPQNVFVSMQQKEEEYLNCDSELSEEEYI